MKVLSNIEKINQTVVNIVINKSYQGTSKILDGISIEDPLLYPGKKLEIRIDRFRDVVLKGTYQESVPDGQTQVIQLIELEDTLANLGISDIATSDSCYYFSNFTIEKDNNLLSQSDAIVNLGASPNIYNPGNNITQPQNFNRKGTPGFVNGEDYNKLLSLMKYVKFSNINLAGNNYQTIALIKTNEEYDFTTRIRIRGKEMFADFIFTCYQDKTGVLQRYLQVVSFESIVKDNDPDNMYKLMLKFKKESGTVEDKTLNFIRIDAYTIPDGMENTSIDIAVCQFEDLINQQLVTPGSVTSENITLGKSEDVEISTGIVGYTSSEKLALVQDGESPIRPLLLDTSGNLNDLKTPGFYHIPKEHAPNWTNRPADTNTSLVPVDCDFRVNVYSDYEGSVRQEYIYQSDTETPRMFYRNCQDGVWKSWTEYAYKYHSHRLEDLEETDNSMHVSKEMIDKWNQAAEDINDSPIKGMVDTVDDLPTNGMQEGDWIAVKNPGGLYFYDGTKWIPKTIEALQAFDVNTRIDVNGLITPALYDLLRNSGIGKKITHASGSFFAHIDTLVSNYSANGQKVGNGAYDLVYHDSLFDGSIGEKSIALGFGSTTNTRYGGIAIGENVVNNGSLGIGRNITNEINGIGIGEGLTVKSSSVVLGKYNDPSIDSYFVVACGNDSATPLDVLVLDKNMTLITRSFKKLEFENMKSDRGYDMMLVDGNNVSQSKFGLQTDIDNLYNTKVDKGEYITIRIVPEDAPEDGSEDAYFNILYDTASMILNTPTGRCLVDSVGNVTLPEGIIINPLSETGQVTIPSNLWGGDVNKILTAEYNEDTETREPINIENEYNHEGSNYPIIVDFDNWIITYKDGKTVNWFTPSEE